ncbi:hypothetical protein V9K67_22310 [Paraflavisolibacter sp. H34]|uniref:hypothetical protein n=1 Tax=Huijunlia imazamoxiresistens TaxID=3127457 RepID=UPI0030166F07
MQSKRRVLYLFGVFILVFGFFIFAILRPSEEAVAMEELAHCTDVASVKANWEKYNRDLVDLDPEARKQSEYFNQVIEKLNSFRLRKKEEKEIMSWLPPRTENLNIVLVPDLSYRIKDAESNPGQVSHDTSLLNHIYHSFQEKTKRKNDSKDFLLVDVSDNGQAQGSFQAIADDLVFDLSKNKGNNRQYFKKAGDRFSSNIARLYNTALQQKVTGADYVNYFSDVLPRRVKRSTLADRFRNILFIITDGYLELNGPNGSIISVSPSAKARKEFCLNSRFELKFPAATMDKEYADLEVYLLEVNIRKGENNCDKLVLEKWWAGWLGAMNVKNVEDGFFFSRENALSVSQQQIDDILKN